MSFPIRSSRWTLDQAHRLSRSRHWSKNCYNSTSQVKKLGENCTFCIEPQVYAVTNKDLWLPVWQPGSCAGMKHVSVLHLIGIKHIHLPVWQLALQLLHSFHRAQLPSTGQRSVLHNAVSFRAPTQSAPPFWGAGSVHVRVLEDNPVPHVWEQSVQSDQLDKPPSTTQPGKVWLNTFTFVLPGTCKNKSWWLI